MARGGVTSREEVVHRAPVFPTIRHMLQVRGAGPINLGVCSPSVPMGVVARFFGMGFSAILRAEFAASLTAWQMARYFSRAEISVRSAPVISSPASHSTMTASQTPSPGQNIPGLNILVVDGVTVIAFGTDFSSIDEQHLDSVRPELLAVTEQGTLPKAVVVDLSHTKFFGSSFIEVLFRVWKRVTGAGGKFAIAGLSGYCLEILTVTHLDTLWKNYPTRQAAIDALKS